MLEPCPDWSDPLAVCFDDTEDPVPVLVPYYTRLCELVVPLTLTDVLTQRGWGFAKDFLDTQPEPPSILEWTSRWRNFVGQVWQVVGDHQRRAWQAAHPKARMLTRRKGGIPL
jgi:hypothetical protein